MYCSIFDDSYVSNAYRPSSYSAASRDDYIAHHLLCEHLLHGSYSWVESLDETNEELDACFLRRIHESVGGPLLACHWFLDE